VAVVRGRIKGWPAKLRDANMNLAVGVCVFALLVALPLWDFGAISARQQIARLDSGEVAADTFDFHALRWDFGDAGRNALALLAKRGGAVGSKAKAALAETERYQFDRQRDAAKRTVRYQIADPALRAQAQKFLEASPYQCDDPCIVLDGGRRPDGKAHIVLVGPGRVTHRYLAPGDNPDVPAPQPAPPAALIRPDTKVEIRDFKGRQVYIDGKPAGDPFE